MSDLLARGARELEVVRDDDDAAPCLLEPVDLGSDALHVREVEPARRLVEQDVYKRQILGLLTGIIMFITGMGYFSIATGLICGLVADLIWKSGGYASSSRAVLSHGVFSCWIIGNFLPFLVTADAYLPTVRAQYGDAYVDELMTYLQPEMYPVLLVACFVTGIIGGFIGRAVLKKHFKRAGIA